MAVTPKKIIAGLGCLYLCLIGLGVGIPGLIFAALWKYVFEG